MYTVLKMTENFVSTLVGHLEFFVLFCFWSFYYTLFPGIY